MFVERCKETSMGCILHYTSFSGKKKRAFIARADQRQILPFGTYFRQVFEEQKNTDNIFGLQKVPADNFYISSSSFNKVWKGKLVDLSSKELCDKWMRWRNYVDVHRTTGVPAVQLCRNTIIPEFGPCDLPNAELAMRIYIMRREIDETELLLDDNSGTLLYKGSEKYIEKARKKDWKFKENNAISDFIWTSNEANEVMNIGVAKGRLGMMVKFYRGLVVPIIELD